MKVIFKQAASFPPYMRAEHVGDIADLPEEQAQDMIDAGLVELVTDDAGHVAPEGEQAPPLKKPGKK